MVVVSVGESSDIPDDESSDESSDGSSDESSDVIVVGVSVVETEHCWTLINGNPFSTLADELKQQVYPGT